MVKQPLDLFRDDFMRDEQVEMCATLLETLRNLKEDDWWSWAPDADNWSREETDIASFLIRHCGESRDCMRTVDFITRRVFKELGASIKAQPGKKWGHLSRKAFLHEHMVPGSSVLKVITERRNDGAGLAETLKKLCYRALVLQNFL